jgi:hypothetical protein
MKAYKLVTLVAAVLITVLLARVFTHEKVGLPQHQATVASSTDVATATHSPGV